MKFYSLLLSGLSCFVFFSHANTSIQGVLLPTREAPTISFSPKNIKELIIIDTLPQGTVVEKGELIMRLNTVELENLIENSERAVKSRELQLARALFDLERQEEQSQWDVSKAREALKRSEEDLEDFLQKRKGYMLIEAEHKMGRALRGLRYKQEELKQLSQMYREDQILEESEEIILTRIKDELSERKFGVEGAKLSLELAKSRSITRTEENFVSAVEKNKLHLKNCEGQAKLDQADKQNAVAVAKELLQKEQSRLSELKMDLASCELKSPEGGILMYGFYEGDRWMSQQLATKIKGGGRLETFTKVGTIVSPIADLVIVAELPHSSRVPEKGTKVKINILEDQLSGEVIRCNPVPDLDGKRRVIISPEWSRNAKAAPGTFVQVELIAGQSS